MRQFNIITRYEFTCKRWREKKLALFSLEMTALARVSLNQIDDPFSLPRGHSNVRAWDPPRLHRDRWDFVCYDLARLIFLPGLVCCLVIKRCHGYQNWGNTSKTLFTWTGHNPGEEKSQQQSNKAKRDCLANGESVVYVCAMCFRTACTIFESHAGCTYAVFSTCIQTNCILKR